MPASGLLKFNTLNRPDDEGPDSAPSPETDSNPHAAILKLIPPGIRRRAWFTMAHLMLEPGSLVADMVCQQGLLTCAMAAMNPQHRFIGVDVQSRFIKSARRKFTLPNLEFRSEDFTQSGIPPKSLDAVIHSFTLHEIYSDARCNERVVTDTLAHHFSLLKQGGTIFIQDFAMPEEDLVLIEIPDDPGRGDPERNLSMSDLLVEYSEKARPYEDPAFRGFYLEELPPRFPRTRLFRLPSKWAHEFILRKDDRANWVDELEKEYTFFTEKDFRRSLRALGARVLYTAPHWDDQIVKARFDKKFKLFSEGGEPSGSPPTSFIAVSRKMADRESLLLQERKPSKNDNSQLRIIAMRDGTDGRIHDIVTRGVEMAEILPYRVTEEGRLHVYVHDGLPRGIVNAVPRGGPNLDGKQWSGHMTEALSVPQDILQAVQPADPKSLVRFAQAHLGLKPILGCFLEDGPGFYPAPDSIDERIETKYLKVEPPKSAVEIRNVIEDVDGFSTRGSLKEFDAQTILNAAGVGLIPSGRLEVQILALYQKLGLPFESWAECPLNLSTGETGEVTKLQTIIAKLAEQDHRFKEVRGTSGTMRAVNAVFVDEGQSGGGVTGLASREIAFVVPERETINTAIVLPLSKSLNGEVMAGITEQFLPVPQRYSGSGYTVSCPSFTLPKDVTNIELARKYIADKFEVPVDCVAKMGESFYCHIGVTPRRVYPFAVTAPGADGWMAKGRGQGVTALAPLYHLGNMLYWDNHDSFMKVAARAYAYTIGMASEMSLEFGFSKSLVPTAPIASTGEVVSIAPAPTPSSGMAEKEISPSPSSPEPLQA